VGTASGAVGLLSGWNVVALVTAGFSLLDALTVLLVRERVAEQSPVSMPTRPAHAVDSACSTLRNWSNGPVAERHNGCSGGMEREGVAAS